MCRVVVTPAAFGRDPRRSLLPKGPFGYLLGLAVLAALYDGAAQLSFHLEFAGPVAAIVWLPVGVGIAFVYLAGLRFLPGVLIGDLLANDYSTLPLGSAIGQTCGNVLEIAVAVILIRFLVRRGRPLATVDGLGGMLIGIASGVAVSATMGTLSLRLGGVIPTDAMPTIWRTWWLGDACGALIVVPLVLAWWGRVPRLPRTGRAVELALLLATTVAAAEVALRSHEPLAYLVFPPLIWAALRFGQRGATLIVTIGLGLTVWNTVHYIGPFAFESISRSVLNTQLFIAAAALSTLYLAAVVSEREQFAAGLAASRARLVDAADTERRRLERHLHDGAQQRLVWLAVSLGHAAERLSAAPDEAALALEDARAQLALAVDELRELAHGIHPAVLSDLGLGRAMRSAAVRATVPIDLAEMPAERVSDAAEATAYHVFAEAVANAQKHARATSICVRAGVRSRTLHIEIVDDGAGGVDEGPGIVRLRDRVEAAGGRLDVESVAGHGTRVAARIPAAAGARPATAGATGDAGTRSRPPAQAVER
jgi:signal transduction histidine kinase